MIWMILKKWKKKALERSAEETRLEETVELAKSNAELRNTLIKQYQPFIASSCSKVCKKYIDPSMDEYSIGLLGFNEAIDKFNGKEGASFLPFADMVIQRRIIDYIRKEIRQTRDILLEKNAIENNGQENMVHVAASLDHYYAQNESDRRKEEILEYQKELKQFNISFSELVQLCPKHIDARENAKQIAQLIARKPELVQFVLNRRQLPVKELLFYVDCSRKTIERHRKYIMAMCLIYIGNYQSLRSYIEPEVTLEGREGYE